MPAFSAHFKIPLFFLLENTATISVGPSNPAEKESRSAWQFVPFPEPKIMVFTVYLKS